jgi:hypothetical protein
MDRRVSMNTSSESTFTSATINADVALASSNIANISNYSLQHQLIIATPLDPLLKHLKKTYASSAGPTDVLGAISKENIDRWLSGDCDDCNDDEGSSILVEKTSRLASGHPPISAASTFQSIHQHNELQLPVSQQRLPLSTSSSLVDALIPPIKPSRRPERTMPDFCYAPTTHVDNLLRTMPHLRHLSSGSIDSSGLGMSESKNLFHNILNATTQSNSLDPSLENVDYATRQHSNLRASTELASFLQTLSNEMPHDKFITVESEVYSKLFSLVHSKTDRSERLAGVAALDALLAVPSFDQDKKTIRFGNNLSNGLKAATADYEFLHAVARALGKMASSAANVDRVEFEIGRSLEWLRSDRGDHRRLAAVLVLRELAREAPTAFYAKTQQSRDGETWISNEFLDNIFPVMRDRRLIVRVCAADALSECIKILMERQPTSMTAPLCNLFSDMMQGLTFDPSDRLNGKGHTFNFQKKSDTGQDVSAAINAHGSLLAVGAFLAHTGGFIMPRELEDFDAKPLRIHRMDSSRFVSLLFHF